MSDDNSRSDNINYPTTWRATHGRTFENEDVTEEVSHNNGDDLIIIDGDVLEDRFEEFGNIYDRFSHVIVCDVTGAAIKEVPYVYARNISRVMESLNTVSMESYPEFSDYAVNGELLCVISYNPGVLCSLVERQDAILPGLHQELRELEQLEMLEENSGNSLCDRLIAFVKTIKVGNSSGNGIFWLPENYQGEEVEDIQLGDEDYMRRRICSHIKHRRLPMARIIPFSEDRINMMNELIDSLENYNDDLVRVVGKSHFAPLLRTRFPSNKSDILKTLMAEEFRCIKNEEHVDNNNLFVFNESHMKIWEETIPKEKALERLEYYVGLYFSELDLSRSFITGSAITASLINSRVTNRNKELWEDSIELLYPKVITEFRHEIHETLRDDNITLWNIRAVSQTEGLMSKGEKSHSFTIRDGSDIDIAVDNTVSDEEYQQIAANHFEVIKRYYPYVKIRQYTKPKGDWNYVIYTDEPLYIPVFRTVEIYRSSFRNICSHHVGAVRGCFTSRWSETPQFYITASAMWTSIHSATPNYHYFAGRKSNPQDIIVKNMIRGIGISDSVLDDIISEYIDSNDIVISSLPFYHGRNIPSSVFSASREWPYVRDEIHRKLDIKFRRKREIENRRKHETELLRKIELAEREREAERLAYLSSIPQESPQIILNENAPTPIKKARRPPTTIPQVNIPSFGYNNNIIPFSSKSPSSK